MTDDLGNDLVKSSMEKLEQELGFQKQVSLDELRARQSPAVQGEPGVHKPFRKFGEGLSAAELTYLADTINRPGIAVRERSQQLRLGGYAGNRRKKNLCDRAFLREVTFSTEGRGRGIKLMEPTEKGLAAVGSKLAEVPGQGGFLHRWFQAHLAGQLREHGYAAAVELERAGKRADVAYEAPDGGWVACEIEMSAQGAAMNIKKDLEAGFVRVESYVRTSQIRDQIEKDLTKIGVPEGRNLFRFLSFLLQEVTN
jgi:hypothetical protein